MAEWPALEFFKELRESSTSGTILDLGGLHKQGKKKVWAVVGEGTLDGQACPWKCCHLSLGLLQMGILTIDLINKQPAGWSKMLFCISIAAPAFILL